MKPVSHAAAGFGAGGDHWSSITAEVCEPGQGTVYALAELKTFEINRAFLEDARFLEALKVTRPGTAAWWVYGDKVRAALLTDERAYAEIMMNIQKELESKALRTMLDTVGGDANLMYTIPEYRSHAVQSRRLIREAIEAACVDSSATVLPPVSHRIDHEEITFSDSVVEYTRYRPQGHATVFFTGLFVSTQTGRPLALQQNAPGVFSLSEPGYGMLIVSYTTIRQMVTVSYDLWTDSMSPAMREEIARQAVLSGWPDEAAPKIVALVSREEAPEVQALLTAPRKVALYFGAFFSGIKKDPPKLKEESRETETKTVTASNDPNQTITFKRIKKLKLRDQDGKLWLMELVNG